MAAAVEGATQRGVACTRGFAPSLPVVGFGREEGGTSLLARLLAYLGTTPTGDTYRPDLIIYGYHSSGPVLLDFTFRNPLCPTHVSQASTARLAEPGW